MRKVGLADAIGIVAVLVAFVWIPGAADPLTYPKLLVLAAGGLALAPFVALRWRKSGRPGLGVLVIAAAILGILVWGVISALATAAPWTVSLFGWWGRGDGLLAWIGAAVLLLGAAALKGPEIARVVTWLMGGATLVAVIGLLQVAGVEIPEGTGSEVTGTMGNTNFAAGYFAMIGVLALGRALTQAALWHRIWGLVLFLLLGFLSVQTAAQQGPAALAAGVVALGVVYALLYRGRYRTPGLIAAAAVVVVGAALLVASFFAVGPLARLWSESTFDIRQEYWTSAVRIMNGLPIFGTGPDSFARYVAEYRPESYVELLGPTLRVSAAHNVALQFGASIGWLGLILWLVAFVGIAVLLLARVFRAPVASIGLTASVAGAFVAYVVQGMVSIDMLPILATGWLIAGLALGASREPIPAAEPVEEVAVPKAKGKAPAWKPPGAVERPPLWAPIAGGVLALVAAVGVLVQASTANAVQSVNSQESALAFLASPWSPCPLRVQVTQQVIQQLPAEVSVPATYDATALDERCAPMINFQSDVAVQQGDTAVGGPSSELGIELDPLLDVAWLIRGRYLLAQGDIAGAEAAAAEAARLQSLYPEGLYDPSLIAPLLAEIEAAKAA